MKFIKALIFIIVLVSCTAKDKQANQPNKTIEVYEQSALYLKEANNLATLPLHCMEVEYPNKLNQTLGNGDDLQTPKVLHPAFYGCFDWHSAVHGHWSLVSLLRQFPDLTERNLIIEKLLKNISKENILIEVAYFNSKHNKSFERTYGWAWVLKLAEELRKWEEPNARVLEQNLKPLTELMVEKYIDFLPKLNYPIRSGEHPNTAFGLSFAFDYAKTEDNKVLMNLIKERAVDFYYKDQNCPITWEPSGFDFLSPCLEEAALMKRVLDQDVFVNWLNDFMPQLLDKRFDLETGRVSDRSDGKLVHLDGVNFSRAWSLNKISEGLPELDHLKNVANKHIAYSLPNIIDDSYEGGHWLGSFAIYALNSVKSVNHSLQNN